jgi:hypothetical protein
MLGVGLGNHPYEQTTNLDESDGLLSVRSTHIPPNDWVIKNEAIQVAAHRCQPSQ